MSVASRDTSPSSAPVPATFSDHAARRAQLARDARLRSLSEVERDLIRLANDPGFARWLRRIEEIGGCANPVHLAGATIIRDTATGAVVSVYAATEEPGGRLLIRCRNRRGSRCLPCSWLYQGDTYHLVRAGLSGGKGVPESVREHPRLFVTLTAPSFGPVHRACADGLPCRPRRDRPVCDHGNPLGCGIVHSEDDPAVGQPLCAACYDYCGHVLWQAHAGRLWNLFTNAVRRTLATALGLPRTKLRDHLVVSFAKVAEYQRRGVIHFHAVIRLDGPGGPDTTPPDRVSAALLEDCVRAAAAAAHRNAPESAAYGSARLVFGEQLDVRPIRAFDSDEQLTDDAVAAYVAKYATKSTETAGAVDYPITTSAQIPALRVPDHVRALIGTCWRLGALPELEHLRLRAWAHMLGYRGHCTTKSRAYSTTYGALRAARAEHRAEQSGTLPPARDDGSTVTESAWRYIGRGYTPGEVEIAAGIAQDIATNRAIAREELAAAGGRWPDVASA